DMGPPVLDSFTIHIGYRYYRSQGVAMRISELSVRTGVAVPTIKYYLRERLLPEGERTARTQAQYGEVHVQRLRVVRALVDAGVSIAEVRRVVATLETPPESAHE